MPNPEDTHKVDERLISLETTIAEMEAYQQDLSDIINQQWTKIDQLTKRLERLDANLDRIEDMIDSPDDNAPPPHY